MSRLRVAVIATDTDAQADRFVAACRTDPRIATVERFDFRGLIDGTCTLALEGNTPFDVVFPRALPSTVPVLGRDDDTTTFRNLRVLQLQHAERHAFAFSLVTSWEMAGTTVVPSLLRCAPFDHKPLQVEAWRQRGLRVPTSVFSADPSVLRRFCREHPRVVVKPAHGRGHARPFFIDDLPETLRAPLWLQHRVDGDDVRIVVAGGAIVAAARRPFVDASVVDVRLQPGYDDGGIPFVAETLTANERRDATTAADIVQHDICALDAKRAHDGTLVFLESNRAPVLVDLEDALGVDVTGAFISTALRLRGSVSG
jgi:glutathione synthase/RimK-type ligase-like ATP-grasp enzyme